MLFITSCPGFKCEALAQIITPVSECTTNGNCTTDKIVNILLGTKKSRLGALPSPQHIDHLRKMVSAFVQDNQPIQLLTLYGALKGYGVFDDRLEADLSDLMALRRFAGINTQVQQVYAPGIAVVIVFEDTTEMLLNADMPELIAKMDIYYNTLTDMIATFGWNFIQVKRQTDILTDLGITCDAFLNQGRINGQVLFAYWQVVQAKGYANCEDTPEYSALRNIGWTGTIPTEQWAHYLERAATEHPEWSITQRAESICLYFGNALARYQMKALRLPHGNPIKASFVPYPPGTPDNMKFGRVEYKLKDSRNNETIPPWVGFGVLESDGEGYHFTCLSIRTMRQSHPQVVQVQMGTCYVRCDLSA